MITCPVCLKKNHHLAVICTSCGGFIQTTVENLDLFATMWKLIDSPAAAFRTIAVAKHKNYAVLLASLAGFAFAFFAFWLYHLGDHAESLINILAAGFALGPFAGIMVVVLVSLITYLLTNLLAVHVSFKNVIAAVAYACVPIVLSFVLVFPLEIMTFGIYLFTKNPSPYTLKPASFVLLAILDGAFTVWSLALLVVGMKSLLETSWLKVFVIVICTLGIVVTGAMLAEYVFLHL